MTTPTRVLVTGGAGYIGSHTCKALAEAGFEPVAYDDLSTGHRWAVRWGPLVEGNVTDRGTVSAAIADHDCQAVLHFAARIEVGESMTHPARFMATNVGGALAVLDAVLERDVKAFVFSSTCATVGSPAIVPIPETHPTTPESPYGESKLMVEKTLRWYRQAYGLPYIALRYFNAAGADASGAIGEAHDPETHLIPIILDVALGRRQELKIFGTDHDTPDGSCIRDYIHVADLARAHVQAVQYLLDGGGAHVINVGTGVGRSVLEVAAAAEVATGRTITRVPAPRRPGDPARLVADARLAKAILGWQAQHTDLTALIADAWRFHQKLRAGEVA